MKGLNSGPLSLCKFLGGSWKLYFCQMGRMWDDFFLSNGAKLWNLLSLSITERTYRYTVTWYSTGILLKFTKSILCCLWITVTRTGIALFLNLMLNDLNLGFQAVIFHISLSLKPTTLAAVFNWSFFAPPLLASVKAVSNIFFPSPIFETFRLPRNSSELSLPPRKKYTKVQFLVYTKDV